MPRRTACPGSSRDSRHSSISPGPKLETAPYSPPRAIRTRSRAGCRADPVPPLLLVSKASLNVRIQEWRKRSSTKNFGGQGGIVRRPRGASPAEHLDTAAAMRLGARPPNVHQGGQTSLRGVGQAPSARFAHFRCTIRPTASGITRAPGVPATPAPAPSFHLAREGGEHSVPRLSDSPADAERLSRDGRGGRRKQEVLTIRKRVGYPETVLKRQLWWGAGFAAPDWCARRSSESAWLYRLALSDK